MHVPLRIDLCTISAKHCKIWPMHIYEQDDGGKAASNVMLFMHFESKENTRDFWILQCTQCCIKERYSLMSVCSVFIYMCDHVMTV